jgi:hypothetical protein
MNCFERGSKESPFGKSKYKEKRNKKKQKKEQIKNNNRKVEKGKSKKSLEDKYSGVHVNFVCYCIYYNDFGCLLKRC